MSDDFEGAMQRERTTEFIATIHWDADSQWNDVMDIDDAMLDLGYQTRIARDNSQLMVFRDD